MRLMSLASGLAKMKGKQDKSVSFDKRSEEQVIKLNLYRIARRSH